MPDARCTRGLVCKSAKESAHEHTGQRRQSDIPCAMLYGLYRALPGVSGFAAPVASRKPATLARSGFRASERLDADH
jgi:hypothetical protein